MYSHAVALDAADPCPGVAHLSTCARALLESPDSDWSMELFASLSPVPFPFPVARGISMGLLPYGAWAVRAALRSHVSRPSPEFLSLRSVIDDPLPWTDLALLSRAWNSLSTAVRHVFALRAPMDLTSYLPVLLRRALSSPVCVDMILWDAFACECRRVDSQLTSGVVEAHAALVLFLSALSRLCLGLGSLPVPPPSSCGARADGSPVSSLTPLSGTSSTSVNRLPLLAQYWRKSLHTNITRN
jgi:hypothetical protein